MTEVDPSHLLSSQRLQEGRDGDGSGSDGAPQATWNRTEGVACESGEEEGGETTWASTDVQPHLIKERPTSWNETDVDRVKGRFDSVEVGGTAEVVRGADHRPTTADGLHSSGGRRKKHKNKEHRKGSATNRRGAKGTDGESFDVNPSAVNWQDDERIRFYNDREEVPPPPLTAESQTGDDNVLLTNYIHGNHEGLHNKHNMYPVQEGDESACVDGMKCAVDADGAYLGSIPTLARHHSMLLGTEKGDWSASQLFMYDSQLALAGVGQSPPEMTGQGGLDAKACLPTTPRPCSLCV